MPFSHHSHSGQFCPGHAKDMLEEVIQTAIAQKMQVFALTEHMPRNEEDFYPEEIEAGGTVAALVENEAAFFKEAVRLREKYAPSIDIIIGFESEWIRDSSLTLIHNSLAKFPYEFFMGSVHHVHTIPIDYDQVFYQRARDIAGGTDGKLFEDYFDSQFEMLKALKPIIVGHFDLIRLKSDDPDRSFSQWPGVWKKILRNLDWIAEYGGILELNSAGLRKGLKEPYPKEEICKEFLSRGGCFCLSDDSHGIQQVGASYPELMRFVEKANIPTLHYLEVTSEAASDAPDPRFPRTRISSVSVAELKHPSSWERKRG
ncbi:histidinolphosphatase [Arachnomyces sp. PD_36]|nr:histidinolphosphatase [Arachnomyces sp. PD_36]